MNKLINDLFPVILGAVLGVLLKYLYDYKGMVHKELWTKRYETYKNLFSLTGILPQYPHKELMKTFLKEVRPCGTGFLQKAGCFFPPRPGTNTLKYNGILSSSSETRGKRRGCKISAKTMKKQELFSASSGDRWLMI